MEEKKMIKIKNVDGTVSEVELLSYLTSDDNMNKYLVYSKGEKPDPDSDEIIYISKIILENNEKKLTAITDDNEWADVQRLLKRIANK